MKLFRMVYALSRARPRTAVERVATDLVKSRPGHLKLFIAMPAATHSNTRSCIYCGKCFSIAGGSHSKHEKNCLVIQDREREIQWDRLELNRVFKGMFNYTSIPALTSFIAQEARAREIRNETGVAGPVAKGSLGVPFHSFCIRITHFCSYI